MAMTEYIGMRYVPIFADPVEWDSARSYESLTIVTYQGASYTSRRPVPASIPINDTRYWALTGNYNAQVELYRQEVAHYSGQIAQVEQVTENLQAQMAGETASGLLTAINDVDNKADTLQSQMAGETASGLLTAINDVDAKADTLQAQMAGETASGLLNKIDAAKLPMKVWMNHGSYALTLVQCGDKFILFDCGNPDERASIISFMDSHMGDSKLSAVVITHFHYDHWSGFSVIAERYCDADTDIFVQMAVPQSLGDEYDAYNTGKNQVNALIQQYGLKAAQVPTQGIPHAYGDATLTIWNTDPTYAVDYVTSFANSALQEAEADPTVPHPSLNNFSLCSLLEYNGSSYLDCGDLEGAGQEKMLQFAHPVTIAKHPHHFVNRQGVFEWYQKVAPKLWLASNNMQTLDTTSLTASALSYYYIFRYQLFTQDRTPIISNIGTECEIYAVGGKVADYVGYLASAYMYPANEVTVAALLPPNFYKDNPYWLMKACTLDDFEQIRIAANAFVKPVFYGNYTWTSISQWPFVQQIAQLMLYASSYASHKTFRIDFITMPRIVDFAAAIGYNVIELYQGFSYANSANGNGYRRYAYGNTPAEVEPATPYAHHTTIPAAEYNVVHYAQSLIAVTGAGVTVPLKRTNSVTATGDVSGTYSGVSVDTSAGAIVFISITASGYLTAQAIAISDGSVTNQTVAKLRVID